MATRTAVCPECGAEVAAGRLSCAACGTLLASVAGSDRRPSRGAGPATDSTGAPLGDAVDAAAASAGRSRTAAAWTTGMDAAEDHLPGATSPPTPPTPPILKDWTGPVPLGVVTPPADGSTPMAPGQTRTPRDWKAPEPAGATSTEPSAPEPAEALVPESESWDTDRDDEASAPEDEHALVAPDVPMSEPAPAPSWPTAPSVPGAYVAPAIVPTAAATVNGRPATAASIAATAVADGTLASIPAEPRPDRWYSVPSPADAAATPGKAGLFSDLPLRTPKDLPGWLTAVATLISAVAFVLPFSGGYVIGGGVDPTYFGKWGLANPANLVPMLLSIALLFITLIPSRIPVSTRTVVLPILLGGLFLGIVWGYATGPFGLGLGADALAIGGIVLIIAGALAAARADDPPKRAPEPDAP